MRSHSQYDKMRFGLARCAARRDGFVEVSLDPNDQPPDEPGPRTLTIQLNRDTLILIAAVLFLVVAILLAVLFPPSQREAGEVAQVDTPAPATAALPTPLSTAIVVPSDTPPALPEATSAVVPSVPPYPEPVEPTLAPAGPSPTDALPRPTAAPGTEGAPAGGVVNQPTGYPAPGGQAGVTVLPTVDGATAAATPGDAATPPAGMPTATQPVPTVAPTQPPTVAPPTVAPPTQPPPTSAPVQSASSGPPPTRTPLPPTAVPVDVIRGTTYWTAADSPVVLGRDTQIAPGASLIIEAGVEVRLGPGVSLFVDGQVFALGQPDRPVRFVGADRPRWEGIFGRPGSSIVLDHVEISGGGAGGTLIASDGSSFALRGGRVSNNGGHIRVAGGSVTVSDTEIAGNDMPYGAALEIDYPMGGSLTLTGNRIGGNRMAAGNPPVQISSQSAVDVVNLDIQRNLLVGQDGPDLTLVTNGPLQGAITCNALIGGSNGLSVRGTLPQVPGLPLLQVRDNAIEKHTPPIIPIYLEFGIGRGATSEVALDMRGNWWESETGPYEPDRHADGRGEAVGDNIEFQPWLTERPACAPVQ